MRTLGYLLRAILLGALLSTALFAAGDSKKNYDIPAGDAAAALKQFSATSGRETLFAADAVRGVKTPAVRGELTAQEAIDALLADTGLVATIDAKTGAFAVRREAPTETKNVASRLAEAQTAVKGGAYSVKDGAIQLDEFEVSATKITGIVNQGIIPREENEAVRYTVIGRDEIERTGVASLPDLMRRISFNQETGTTTQRTFAASPSISGNFLGVGEMVNLRGMGNGQTLIMINGRRIYGGDGSGADINRIPLAAVERIEILPTSGSAIYGGSSVGGVVNVVLRTGYQGTEISAYLGGSTEKGSEEHRLELFHGQSFNEGRTTLTLSLNYSHQNELTRGERDYDARAVASPGLQPGSAAFNSVILPMMLSPRGTIYTSSPLGLGIPSNPGARFAAIPAGSDGVGLTPASFSGTAGQASISTTDRIARARLRNPSTVYAGILSIEHALRSDTLGAYTELTWRRSEDPVYFPAANTAVTLTATDPRNPFRTNVTPGFVGRSVTIYRDLADLGDDLQVGIRTTKRVVAGLKGKFATAGGRNFNWAIDGSWDENRSETRSWSISAGFPHAARHGYYNLFRDLTGVPVLPEAELSKFGRRSFSTSAPTIAAVNLRLNGDLFELWGGPVRFSLGAEGRRERNESQLWYADVGEYVTLPGAPAVPTGVVTSVDTTRDVRAAYGELVVPVLRPSHDRPWLHSLEFSAALRHEQYDEFEAATPPVAAMKIGLTRDLALRALYAEGFQPPTLIQLNRPLQTQTVGAGQYADPLRPGQVSPAYVVNNSGNPELRPETAKTWDVGFVFTPRWVPGLSVNSSYFRYDKQDVVASQSIQAAIVYFPELILRDPASPADVAAGRPGPVNTFFNKPVNVARQFTDGVDLTLRYDSPETRWGRFLLTASGTWTKRSLSQSRPDLPEVNGLGVAGFLFGNFIVEKKASGSLTWNRREWSVTWTGTYTGPFESSTTAPSARNPSGSGIDGAKITTPLIMDLQVSYQIPARTRDAVRWRNWLAGTKWTIGALNFTNEEPGLWSDNYRGLYNPYVDPRQRFVYLQIKKSL